MNQFRPGPQPPNYSPTISANTSSPTHFCSRRKAIRWYCELLLHHDKADDMTGFDNGILIVYGMCPPCKLQEYYQLALENCTTHFMQGTAAKIWGDDMHKVMYTSAADWTDWVTDGSDLPFFFCYYFCLAITGCRKLIILKWWKHTSDSKSRFSLWTSSGS